MKDILVFLEGKRTYIVAIVIACLNLAVACGWVSPAHLDQINLVLVACGLGALRRALRSKKNRTKKLMQNGISPWCVR